MNVLEGFFDGISTEVDYWLDDCRSAPLTGHG